MFKDSDKFKLSSDVLNDHRVAIRDIEMSIITLKGKYISAVRAATSDGEDWSVVQKCRLDVEEAIIAFKLLTELA